MASKFTRGASGQLIAKLQSDPLFTSKIYNDCLTGNVFMAIRSEVIDFYYKGGRLFEFDKKEGFKTHIKYAAVIDHNEDYVSQRTLSSLAINPDFISHYDRIKENCSKYSGIEANGVSDLYMKNSYLCGKDIVILDIEASFPAISSGKKSDRIDIVVYNKQKRIITFVEAKHFTNSEIWSTGVPKVIGQIKRYDKQIITNKDQIVTQYSNYIQSVNSIFNIQIPLPTNVEDRVILLIFGFDTNQRKKLIDKDNFLKSMKGIKLYKKGNTKSLIVSHLLSEAKVIQWT